MIHAAPSPCSQGHQNNFDSSLRTPNNKRKALPLRPDHKSEDNVYLCCMSSGFQHHQQACCATKSKELRIGRCGHRVIPSASLYHPAANLKINQLALQKWCRSSKEASVMAHQYICFR
jgi:hypothetical protein